MNVSRSAYYAWDRRPAQLITETELKLYRCCKRLFNESRQSLGSRQMMKNLRKEGFNIGRYKVMSIMRQLGLYVKQRTPYKVTTMRNIVIAWLTTYLTSSLIPAALIKYGRGM